MEPPSHLGRPIISRELEIALHSQSQGETLEADKNNKNKNASRPVSRAMRVMHSGPPVKCLPFGERELTTAS